MVDSLWLETSSLVPAPRRLLGNSRLSTTWSGAAGVDANIGAVADPDVGGTEKGGLAIIGCLAETGAVGNRSIPNKSNLSHSPDDMLGAGDVARGSLEGERDSRFIRESEGFVTLSGDEVSLLVESFTRDVLG